MTGWFNHTFLACLLRPELPQLPTSAHTNLLQLRILRASGLYCAKLSPSHLRRGLFFLSKQRKRHPQSPLNRAPLGDGRGQACKRSRALSGTWRSRATRASKARSRKRSGDGETARASTVRVSGEAKGHRAKKKPHRGKSEGTGADKTAPAGEGARKPRKRVERSERAFHFR